MNKARLYAFLLMLFVASICLTSWYCANNESKEIAMVKKKQESFSLSFDSTLVETFYAKYPKLILYKKQVLSLYQKNNFDFIWYDKKGRKETADVIYNKINNLFEDGVITKVPYKETLDALFQKTSAKPDIDVELFLSNYYFYYTNKVLQGIDDSKSNELEWYLPREKQSYVTYLDSLLVDPKLIDKKEQHIEQYYKLKTVLKKYRDLEQKGGWDSITVPKDFVSIKPGDSSDVVAKIRTRLFLTGDIDVDSGRKLYGFALQQAVLKYKKRNGFKLDKIILPKHIDEMNVPISSRIKTIIVNMERCRWIATDVAKAKEFIVVNIPSYHLRYFKDGQPVLNSKVVVGSMMNKTVIFSGMMSYIVFSPYWNVPTSIKEKEILPGIAKNKNYLAKHNMEWNGANIRQKPGKNNSLGLVKFLFPNSNNIYLHDSPAKELFNQEKRAFSHGCIRVEKPKELANLILEDDENWTPEKIDAAMNKGKESWYTLKNKIPVYIGYFTAWVDADGTINFYKDIYERDERLAAMLVEE
ncbi:L,D-transpeptidase family protein [Flavobacterium sp. AS60]|uniref:L,D-transpeptidase family protein n=1 Tax=Flavobacterium anseongense TaxID=2910677 RepID=UPI001EFFA18B|nr:L,D-transpeptidase family protein [Flavobacterium sp. AS60]MCF6129658.1 L,D-transpeptidase family protein [Flavobacterium sp. AS60]